MSFPSGFLIVDKPAGVTSFSIVSLVRRLTGVRRVGHAGTLDPLASGVLPIAVGQAARFIEYLDDEAKVYLARVRFGSATDTYDAEGKVTDEHDASSLTREAIERALPAFLGEIDQTPPAYSAIKVAGKPLYRYAREGIDVELKPRRVRIDAIDLLGFAGGIGELTIRCGKGTYIRSLAHDLGRSLGPGAHLAGLRRTHTGGFGIADAHPPEELAAAAAEDRLSDLILAPDRAVERRPAAVLAEPHAGDVRAGRDIQIPAPGAASLCRAYSVEGQFLGILGAREAGCWHPEKVIPAG